jgi:hypothetical protein
MVHVGQRPREMRGQVARSLTVIVLCAVASGCEDEPINGRPVGPVEPGGQRGKAVLIERQEVQSGFALGHRRKSFDLGSFQISQHPITIGEYRGCVSAGRCKNPRETACAAAPGMPVTGRANFHDEGLVEDVAVTCTGLQEARQYCRWVGGSLPTLEQWLLAARGASPLRFPWGERPATCAQHALGIPQERKLTARCPQAGADLGRIGQHAAGASVFGIQDILLTRGELLEVSPQSLFQACRGDAASGDERGCLVSGMEPGAIDSVQELRSTGDRPDTAGTAYGFRCVWAGAS